MWMPDAPENSAALRQGDLLVDLALPSLKWPLAYARAPKADMAPDQPIVLPAGRMLTYLVVSQCCTIENKSVAALARVRNTRPLSDSELCDLEREVPTDDPEIAYAYTEHALKPVGKHLHRTQDKVWVADFTSIQTYSGSIADFQSSRVAAMSPEGRRALRIRLGAFWARAEAEDKGILEQHGLSAGFILELIPAAPVVATASSVGARCTR